MNTSGSINGEFTKKLAEIIEANLNNPQFGVSMLARELGMSRSSLHRKVNSITKLTVSQFITQVRLKHALEILRHSSFPVSEVAHKVGFNDVSYFIKRFHEYYGYSPGEVGNRDEHEDDSYPDVQSKKKQLKIIIGAMVFVVALAVIGLVVFRLFSVKHKKLDKTIAVLRPEITGYHPDSYLIDGIIEDLNIKLGLIQDLEVIPWTSVRKYRNTELSIPEIAKDLHVNFIVESSGYILDEKINLKITFVNANKHTVLDSYTYTKSYNDFFKLQDEISNEVAEAFDAEITPEEHKKISKKPTENEIAYANYMKAKRKREDNIESAIPLLEKALEYDDEYALAYAELAITYYMMNSSGSENNYSHEICKYADLAMSYDNQHDICLISKAYDYINKMEYEMAIPYLERALKYNPNSIEAIRQLRDIYEWPHFPDREKFLEYALKAIRMDIPSIDYDKTTNLSDDYYRLGIAFRASGFFEEAILFLNRSIEINPDNNIQQTLTKCEVILDMEGNYQQAKDILLECVQKYSADQWVHGYLGRTYYLLRDYANALEHYQKAAEIRSNQNLPDYGPRIGRLAVIYLNKGETKKSGEYINLYFEFAESQDGNARHFHLCGAYSLKRDKKNAIEQMEKYSRLKDYNYFQIRLFKDDPIFDYIRNMPQYDQLLSEIETKFWKKYEQTRSNLEEKRLL